MKHDADRMMPIGEVERSIKVTRRMILNYEQRGLITPDAKDGERGNRYYTVDTIARIRGIRLLQNMGLSLEEIRDYYNDDISLAPLIKRLEKLRDELNMNIEKLYARLNAGNGIDIRSITLPRQMAYCRSAYAETVEQKKEMLRAATIEAMRLYGSDTSKRMFFIEFPLADPNTVSFCVSVPQGSSGERVCELPQSSALCITWHGGYSALPAVREKIVEYARREGIALMGICRHIYFEGPPQHRDESKLITQVALPIAKP